MPVVITQTADPAGVAASSNVATYSSVSIGTASTNRVVALVVTSELTSASPDSATIDYGSGAVAMSASTLGNFGAVYARVFYARAPTGTTATFAVTFGASPGSTANHVSVYSITDGVVSASGGNDSTDMDATAPLTTGSITIASNGGFLAVAAGATDTVAKTWANATEDLDIDAGTFRHTTATRTTSGTVTVTCTGGTNNEDGAMSWIILVQGDNLDATGITASPVVGTPALTQTHSLSATGISASPAVGTPALTQQHVLTATGIATGAPSVGTPVVEDIVSLPYSDYTSQTYDGYGATHNYHNAALDSTHSLTATGIDTGAPTVGSPSLTQLHVLTPSGIATSAPSVGTPAVTQVHSLTAVGLTASPGGGTPVITQVHALTATGITASPVVGTPTLTDIPPGNLYADDLATGAPTVGNPALTQLHVLTASGIDTGSPSAGLAVLTQLHALATAGISLGAPVIDSPTASSYTPPRYYIIT